MDKLQYWRESAAGISSLAHFLSKDTIDHFNTIVKPMVYLSMFYFFSNPRSTFASNYAVLLCLVYCVTGMAYAFAIYFEPGPAQLVWITSMNSLHLHIFLHGFTDNNLHLCLFCFYFLFYPSLVVVSACSCGYDSHCKPEQRYCIDEDPSKILLPKMGFGSLYHCKC